jgi:hypothetical protein
MNSAVQEKQELKTRNSCFSLIAFSTQKSSGTHKQYITFFLTEGLQTAF